MTIDYLNSASQGRSFLIAFRQAGHKEIFNIDYQATIITDTLHKLVFRSKSTKTSQNTHLAKSSFLYHL